MRLEYAKFILENYLKNHRAVEANREFKKRVKGLLQKTTELVKIFTAILEKSK